MCKGRHLALLTHWPTCQPVYYIQSVPVLSAESASCGSWKLWIAQPLVQLELCIEKCPPFHSHLHLLLICWKRPFRSLEGLSNLNCSHTLRNGMKCSQEPPSTAYSWCDWSKSYAMVSCWTSSMIQSTVNSKTLIMTAYIRLIDSSRRRLFTGSWTTWKMFWKHKVQFNVQFNRQDSLKETVEETRRRRMKKKEDFPVAWGIYGVSLQGWWVIIWWCGGVKTWVFSYFIKNFIRSSFIKRTKEQSTAHTVCFHQSLTCILS